MATTVAAIVSEAASASDLQIHSLIQGNPKVLVAGLHPRFFSDRSALTRAIVYLMSNRRKFT